MKVNGKLLEKYYKGHCTVEEQDAVEQWLASATFDDAPLQLPKTENKDAHKQIMWENISQEFSKSTIKVIPLHKKLTRYAAAFIVLVFMGYFSMSIYSDKEKLNTSLADANICIQKTKTIPVMGENFVLIQDNCIKEVIADWKKTKSKVSFSGKIEILHNNKKPLRYHMLTSNNASIKYKQSLRYYALKVKDNNDLETTHLVDEINFRRYFPKLQFFIS